MAYAARYARPRRTEIFSSREGPHAFLTKYRPALDSSIQDGMGPGSCFEIDATPGDTTLVSRTFRVHVIGRAQLYIVVDVFSTMITGVYIGLETPSWIATMMALTGKRARRTNSDAVQ